MIEDTLRVIVGELDQSLQREIPGGGNRAALTSLVDLGGGPESDAADKLCAFVVNLEREVIPVRGLQRLDAGDANRIAMLRPPVHLNLLLMFAANFNHYPEALRAIESTIQFFQGRGTITPQGMPGLDPRIEQLTMEIENLSLTDLSNLWGIVGGRYVPSVLYRLRLLAIDGQSLESQPRRVVVTGVDVRPEPGARTPETLGDG
jgi:hypothetical protein